MANLVHKRVPADQLSTARQYLLLEEARIEERTRNLDDPRP
ncbi:hypothetical protein ACIQM0_30880 [Streptomyces sp. NPDC091387]